MADTKSNRELADETAEALLQAIQAAASDCYRRNGSEGLERMARAYALVVVSQPGKVPEPFIG